MLSKCSTWKRKTYILNHHDCVLKESSYRVKICITRIEYKQIQKAYTFNKYPNTPKKNYHPSKCFLHVDPGNGKLALIIIVVLISQSTNIVATLNDDTFILPIVSHVLTPNSPTHGSHTYLYIFQYEIILFKTFTPYSNN